MADQVKQTLSSSAEKQLNKGRKRKINVSEWKDNKNKFRRNAGQPYKSRKGLFMPGKRAPKEVNVCRCLNQCAEISPDMKVGLFQNFYKMNYDEQSAVLVGLITLQEVKRREVEEAISRRQATFQYKLCINGKTFSVCKKTLLDTFQISSRRVQTLQAKMKIGIDVSDKRGKHFNRPHAVKYDVKDLIRQHINSMPTEESHYSRSVSQKQYLSPELCVVKMYNLFKESNSDIKCTLSMYRDIFRSEFNLRFGAPRSDSCSYCDELYIQLVAADTKDQREKVINQSTLHHMKAETAYKSLRDDVNAAKNNPGYVVLCTDMQQVLFSPTLNHSSVYYQRQFATYNQGIHNMGSNKAFFFVWHESVAKRGSAEVTSCILKYIEMHFKPLKNGEKKSLVVWSDRCIGQNNNWRCIALYHYLIRKKYFTAIDQKFLVSGHSFLPCDRDFALIERSKKKCTVYDPWKWVEVIANAGPGFSVYYMNTEDFVDLLVIERMLKRDPKFKITSSYWIKFSEEEPNRVRTRVSHNVLQPFLTYEILRTHNRRNQLQPLPAVLPHLYNDDIPIKKAKKKDLLDMCKYLPPQYRGFYENLKEY